MKALPLSDRVRSALNDPIGSAALAELIDDTRVERENLQATMARVRGTAVDPLSSDAAAEAARKDMHDLSFQEERLASSIARLDHRLAGIRHAEEQARRRDQYDRAVAARDAAAEELRAVYPEAVARIVGALAQMAAADTLVASANTVLPEDANRIADTEHLLCPLNGVGENWPIGQMLRLPAKFGAKHQWPPERTVPAYFGG